MDRSIVWRATSPAVAWVPVAGRTSLTGIDIRRLALVQTSGRESPVPLSSDRVALYPVCTYGADMKPTKSSRGIRVLVLAGSLHTDSLNARLGKLVVKAV